jgi:3-hydroxymyristoyl/3-hydroxydecanoyl-(acyl carrier protein) dehydratase
MDGPFRAFTFVDRIASCAPGGAVRGAYTIPAGLEDFPAALVAEALGQLAAWSAMAALDFQRRPVAGIAGAVELLGAVQAGQTLDLAAELETADAEAVAYHAVAHVNGAPVLRLSDCVGPMVPMEDFDDPQAVRDRFALLCAGGRAPGGFTGVPPLLPERSGGEAGQRAHATLRVPASAPFFADHFPRRPVFPGSLLMHANLQLAAALAGELPPPAPGRRWRAHRVADMKLRAFIPPGETLALEARLDGAQNGVATLAMQTRQGKRLVGGARVELVPEGLP